MSAYHQAWKKTHTETHYYEISDTRDKEKILQMSKEKKKEISYKGLRTRKSFDSSIAILEGRKEWWNGFKILKKKKKDSQPRILYSVCM